MGLNQGRHRRRDARPSNGWDRDKLPPDTVRQSLPTSFVDRVLSTAGQKIMVENNYSAQMAGLIREKTGIAMDNKIVKFDGRPFSQNEVYEGVKTY